MTCRICQFNWCWLCLNECLENHYQQQGMPCYGKQFYENTNPDEAYFLQWFMNHSIYYISTFFILYITVFMIQAIFQNRNMLFEGNLNNNNINFNQQNDIENNLNNQLIGNNIEIRNNINEINNQNRSLTIGQKLGLFIAGECAISIFFFILVITNGFFLIPLMILLLQTLTINNIHVKKLGLMTFFILFSIFFPTGIFFSCFWICMTSLYFIYKIIIL